MSSDSLEKNFDLPVTGDEAARADQARAYTRHILRETAEDIDLEMGEGAAKNYPELLASLTQIRAYREGTLMNCRTLQEGFSITIDTFVECSDEIAYLLKDLKKAL